jgi:hypothetical protein
LFANGAALAEVVSGAKSAKSAMTAAAEKANAVIRG